MVIINMFKNCISQNNIGVLFHFLENFHFLQNMTCLLVTLNARISFSLRRAGQDLSKAPWGIWVLSQFSHLGDCALCSAFLTVVFVIRALCACWSALAIVPGVAEAQAPKAAKGTGNIRAYLHTEIPHYHLLRQVQLVE